MFPGEKRARAPEPARPPLSARRLPHLSCFQKERTAKTQTVLWPLFLGVQLLVVGLQVAEPWKGVSVLYWFLLLGPVLLATILVHELGHSLAARSVGGTADGILMWPLGGLALCGHRGGPKADLWVSAAGPLTHLPMTAAWLGGLYGARVAALGPGAGLALVGGYPPTYSNLALNVCNGAVLLNIALFAFNLLVPAYPLDGGRIFVDLLLICRVPARTTAIVAVAVSCAISVGLAIYGLIPPINAMLVLVAAFVFASALGLAQAVRTGTLHQHPLFQYSFADSGPDACPADLAAMQQQQQQQQQQGSALPVYGGRQQQHMPPPPPPGANPFAGRTGLAQQAQAQAQWGAPPPPPYYAQHATYAPAVAPGGGGWAAPPPPPPAR